MKFTLTLTSLSLLFIGCTTSNSLPPQYRQQAPKIAEQPTLVKVTRDTRTKHKMQKVDEQNFSDSYMYPEDGKLAKKDPVKKIVASVEPNTTTTPKVEVLSHGMSKDECILMMGEEKFAHYAQMFGGDTGAIKRCAMLKAMR